MNTDSKPVPFRENFMFIFLVMFLFFGIMVSLIPYEHVGRWIIFNCCIAILATFVNYILWLYQKHDSKRYNSLTSFVMLVVLTYYLMSPAFKILYPSLYFWILLVGTLGFTVVLFINRINVARGILNPRELWFKKILLIYSVIFSCVFILLTIYASLIDSDSKASMAAAIILFLVGFLFLSLSPVFLTTPKMAKTLEEMSID